MSPTFLRLLVRALLLAYFPFLLLLCLFDVWLIALLARYLFAWLMCLLFSAILIVLFAVTLIQTIVAARVLFARLPDEDPMELRLPRARCRDLYAWVERVASARRLRPPGEIRATADGVAHVREASRGIEVLALGGVAVAAFTQEALAGVVAHELAHCAAGDTRLTRNALRRLLVMGRLEDQFIDQYLLGVNPLVWLLRAYHGLFRLAWAAMRRRQELAADQHMLAQAGPEVAAVALLHVVVCEHLPWVRLSSIAESYVRSNQPLSDLFAEQARRARNVDPGEWDEACRKELARPAGLFDSHPALRDRLKALGVAPRKAIQLALPQAGARASDLIPDWSEIERELTQRVIAAYREDHLAKMELGQILRGRP